MQAHTKITFFFPLLNFSTVKSLKLNLNIFGEETNDDEKKCVDLRIKKNGREC